MFEAHTGRREILVYFPFNLSYDTFSPLFVIGRIFVSLPLGERCYTFRTKRSWEYVKKRIVVKSHPPIPARDVNDYCYRWISSSFDVARREGQSFFFFFASLSSRRSRQSVKGKKKRGKKMNCLWKREPRVRRTL